MRKALDLNDIQIFASAARAGSLSEAAKEFGLPTSTVSRSLTRLENLGYCLSGEGSADCCSRTRAVIGPLMRRFVDAQPELRVDIRPYSSLWDREPKEDVDVFFKIQAPRGSSWLPTWARISIRVFAA